MFEDVYYLIAMAGTVAFAVSAVLGVADKKIDLFTAVVFGGITACGGGTVRDLILSVPVFWSQDLNYIWVSIVASIVAFYGYRFFERKKINTLFLYVDGIGISLFGIQAVDKVWGLEFALPIAPVILGIITAIGGGLIRDVLAGRPTLLMKRELYAIPVLIGCSSYVFVLKFMPGFQLAGSIICLTIIFVIRAAAIHKNLEVPGWMTMGFSRSKS